MNKCEFCGKSYVYGGGASSEPNCNCFVENQPKPKYKANFLWPYESGSLEELLYEFANAKTEEYQKAIYLGIKYGFKK